MVLSPAVSQWADLIQQASIESGVSAPLIAAVVTQESSGNANAVSSGGAQGLMQLIPSTARSLGVSNSFDPIQNLRGGAAYLRGLLDKYAQNVSLALAAYNAGPGAVDRYGGIPPYPETQQYVSRVTAYAAALANDFAAQPPVDVAGVTSGPDVLPSAPSVPLYWWLMGGAALAGLLYVL